MNFSERTFKDAFGATVIQSRLRPAIDRQGFEPGRSKSAVPALGHGTLHQRLVKLKPSDTELWLTTVTETHLRTLRLKEIQYRVDAVKNGLSRKLFETSIEVADQRINPRVTINATPFVKTF